MDVEYSLTAEQAETEMNTLRKLFTAVRLLDASKIEKSEDDTEPCRSSEKWIAGLTCRHCVALKALKTKKLTSKLEFLDGKAYQVMARYVEIDGAPHVMEIMKCIESDAIINIDGREELAGKIAQYHDEIYIDALTGAYNRRYYEEKLRHRKISAGVVMIDIDDFKLYNDTLGHGAGDAALIALVNTVRKSVRETDIMVRTGGDEFLLVLPGITEESFTQKLNYIRNRVNRTTVSGYSGIKMSVSMGGVFAQDEPAEDAAARADKMMYQAKSRKNTVVTENSPVIAVTDDRLEILIVDDSDINRQILSGMLGSGFIIHQASNGRKATELLERLGTRIALVLLDVLMPEMDGFDVLKIMNDKHWIDDIPVIMITSDNSTESIRQAFRLGVSDYVGRPYDATIVHQRVLNTIKLCSKQRRLVKLLSDEINEKEKNNRMMISILGHIVEFRNGESGMHVLHIQELTELLLERIINTGRYTVSAEEASLIPTASALHDIGKIGIEDSILNKPDKLTPEEFEVMKTHTVIGASMLEGLEQFRNEELLKIARQICRWHHERYDGKGYPDGLKGDEIPLAAQVVAVADVYDALTSSRVYKPAYSHENAVKMILGGECGAFAPAMLKSFMEIQDDIKHKFGEV